MQFIHTWVDQGVITEYSGKATIEDLLAAQDARNRDPRMAQARFSILDTRQADGDAISIFEAHLLGRNDAKIWARNPDLHMLLVSESEVILSLMEAYCAYTEVLCCPWKISIHQDFSEAAELANRLFGAGIDLGHFPSMVQNTAAR